MLVRCTLAQHVAELAEIALKFLELSHWRVEASATTPTGEAPGGTCNWCNTSGFESELQALQVFIGLKLIATSEACTFVNYVTLGIVSDFNFLSTD